MTQHTLPHGKTLLYRVAGAPRAGRTYIPPVLRFNEYLQFSEKRGGRLLWTADRLMRHIIKDCKHIILFSIDTPTMVIGDIVSAGTPYNPRTWDALSPYQVPDMDNEPHRQWVELENVRELDGFNPADWMVVSASADAEPLENHLDRRRNGAALNSEGVKTTFTTRARTSLLIIMPKDEYEQEQGLPAREH